MIFVLGISLIIVNIRSLVKTKEGYEDMETDNIKSKGMKSKDMESDSMKSDSMESDSIESDSIESKGIKLQPIEEPLEKEGYTDIQDETIIENIKQLDPLILNTIKNLIQNVVAGSNYLIAK
jgi:pentapeptide MXKDX repeat protein